MGRFTLLLVAALFTRGLTSPAADTQSIETLLKNLQAEDATVQSEAAADLGKGGVEAVEPVARILGTESPATLRAARTALETIAHHAARPGADAEREKVAGAFAAACSAAKNAQAKNALLEILSFVGTAQVVPVVAECLDVEETHEMACLALARIEGEEAAEALRNALSEGAGREDSLQIALLSALGMKNDITAAYLLSDLASNASSDEVYLAALEALSKNPMAYAYVHVFWDALPPADSEEQKRMRSRVWDCFLRVGEAFIGAGEVGAASDLYCELLDNASNTAEKCGVVAGLGLSGRRDAPGRVFEALEDEEPEVRAAALMALETLRLGGFYAGVGPALEQADTPLKVGLLRVLGKRTEPQAGPLIIACLDHEEPAVRAAALGAAEMNGSQEVAKAVLEAVVEGKAAAKEGAVGVLGRMPGEEITTAIVEAARTSKAEPRVQLLRALSARRDPGAQGLLMESARADDAAVRVAAYGGLGALGSPEVLPALLSGIKRGGDDAVAAEKALASLPASGTLDALAKAARESSGEARASLVRVLGRRDDARVVDILLEAARDDNESVRVAAVEGLSGRRDKRVLPVLLKAAAEGPQRVRTSALLGCLAFGKTIEQDDPDTALSVYHTALKTGGTLERLEALSGLGRLADPRSIEFLKPLLKAGDTRGAAAAALLAVAAKLGDDRKDEAVKLLKSALPLAPSSPAAPAAVARLRSLGVDYDMARDSGFLTRWWLLGPFPDPQGRMLGRDLVDPAKVRGGEGKTVEVKGQKMSWKFHHTADPRGVVNLLAAVAPQDNVGAYAYAEVTVPGMKRVTFKFGSDDSLVCWLNGKKLHTFGGVRGLTVDQDQVATKLESGTNRILLKVLNQAGGWGFCVRITDRKGAPVILEESRK